MRRTATTEYIGGDDTLDMEPETVDRSYPLFGKVPLPPVMIQQLDMILTLGFLTPLRKKVLEDFQKIVSNNKPKSWMTIYLITFMSLHSCATLTDENYKNARKHGLKVSLPYPTRTLSSSRANYETYSGDLPCPISSLSGITAQMSSCRIIIIAQSPAIHSK